jgi:hypothetical protein
MARIRPVTQFKLPKLTISGATRVNGGGTRLSATGTLSTQRIRILGAGTWTPAAGTIQVNGALPLRRIQIFQAAGQTRRRSVGSGVLATKRIAVTGTLQRVDADSAVVPLYNAQGNPSGYGPSDDPEGVLFGMTGLLNGDVFWFHSVPVGLTATPFPGGSYTLAVSLTILPGTYQLGWTLRRALTGARTLGTKNVTIS